MDVPQQWLFIPGGPLKTRSYNQTYVDTADKNYVLQSTYFQVGFNLSILIIPLVFLQYMANISMIEYVPAKTGKLFIDVVSPVCPMIKNGDGEWVESAWCPLTGTCEEFCISSLEMQPDW